MFGVYYFIAGTDVLGFSRGRCLWTICTKFPSSRALMPRMHNVLGSTFPLTKLHENLESEKKMALNFGYPNVWCLLLYCWHRCLSVIDYDGMALLLCTAFLFCDA